MAPEALQVLLPVLLCIFLQHFVFDTPERLTCMAAPYCWDELQDQKRCMGTTSDTWTDLHPIFHLSPLCFGEIAPRILKMKDSSSLQYCRRHQKKKVFEICCRFNAEEECLIRSP